MRCTLSRALFLATFATLLVQSCSSRTAPLWENFSGEKAFAHVQHLVDLGPRPAGSEALEKSRLYIIEQLKSAGWTVARSEFSDQTPRGKITFVNLIARFGIKEKNEAAQFFLCSHYDTKSFDTIRFVGANDGGSSTGLLIEMARVLAMSPALAAKIELLFFDGEEAFENFTTTDGLYGSRHFAKELRDSGKAKSVRGGILFDMVGDKLIALVGQRGIFEADLQARIRERQFCAGRTGDDFDETERVALRDELIASEAVPTNAVKFDDSDRAFIVLRNQFADDRQFRAT